MELTEYVVRERAGEYADAEPLYDVERQHIETIPETFVGDDYGRRDAQWIVRWYFRRYLGAYPDRERREREEAFRETDFEAVIDALDAVINAVSTTGSGPRTVTAERDIDAALAALTGLRGVDVSVASAFLQFIAPERFVAVDSRTWRVLVAAGELDGRYPDTLTPADYRRFDGACRSVMERTGVDAWTLYRALWRSWPLLSDSDHDAEVPP